MLYHCGFTEDGVKFCIFESEDLDETVTHVKNHVVVERTCPLCKKQLHSLRSLVVHLKREYNIKPHFCTCCKQKKKFVTKADVRRHERSMSGIRDFGCNTCHMRFTNDANRVHHLKTNYHLQRVNDKIDLNHYKFSCKICKVGLNTKKQKETHEKTPKHNRIINYIPI